MIIFLDQQLQVMELQVPLVQQDILQAVEQVETILFLLVQQQVELEVVEQVEQAHHILMQEQEQLILVAEVVVLQDHQMMVAQVALV